jgi:hypothetical protein
MGKYTPLSSAVVAGDIDTTRELIGDTDSQHDSDTPHNVPIPVTDSVSLEYSPDERYFGINIGIKL